MATRLTLDIVHGSKRHAVNLSLSDNQAGDSLSVCHLQDKVASLTEVPPACQKLIFKGQSLSEPNKALSEYGLKNGSKVMLIGKKPTPVNDPEMQKLKEVQSSVDKQEAKLSDLTHELDGIHRGYMAENLKEDALRLLKKQLLGFEEILTRMLEKLDSLRFDDMNMEGKSKRKSTVVRIQTLLDRIDGLSKGLQDMIVSDTDKHTSVS